MKVGSSAALLGAAGALLVACSTGSTASYCSPTVEHRVTTLLEQVPPPGHVSSTGGQPAICDTSVDDVHATRAFDTSAARETSVVVALARSLHAQGWTTVAPLSGGVDYAFGRTENDKNYWAEVMHGSDLPYGNVAVVVNAGAAME